MELIQEKNICLKCNKKMKIIKRDFKGRKYCKKCFLENINEWLLKEFIKDLNKIE